jgi:uncharacterized protein (TIGR02246 family)
MPAHEPEEIHALFAEAISKRDLEGILSLYEENAILAQGSGQYLRGRAAIREALGDFLALQPTFTVQATKVIRSNDVALLYSKWEITGTEANGSAVSFSVQPTLLARRQPDGLWKVVIDDPSGGQFAKNN